MSTVLIRSGLNAKSRTQIPSLSRGKKRRVHHLDIERRPVVGDRDRVQVGNELDLGDRVGAWQRFAACARHHDGAATTIARTAGNIHGLKTMGGLEFRSQANEWTRDRLPMLG